MVAIDAATGERRWVYQTVHRDIWDYDVPSQPVLREHPQEWRGRTDPGRGAADQARRDFPARPAHGRADLRTLPEQPGDPRGTRKSRARPLRRRSLSLALPNFREDRVEKDMWGLTPLDQLACRIEFKKMRYEGHFTPPMRGGGGYGQAEDTWGGSFQYPGNAGGFNWGSVSVDADNGLLIGAPMLMGNRIVLRSTEDRAAESGAATPSAAPSAHAANGRLLRLQALRRGPGGPGGGARWTAALKLRPMPNASTRTRVLYRGDTAPFMSTWRLPLPFVRDDNGQPRVTDLPCYEPPFGQIGVIDLNTNKLLWKRRLGSMKESGPFGIQTGLSFMVGTPLQGGNLATRGGLIFHGGAMDSTFRALDMRTGAVKWESPLPGSAHASPMSYVGKNGKQYVLITVPNPSWRYPRTAGDNPTDDQGGYVIAYALPDGAK